MSEGMGLLEQFGKAQNEMQNKINLDKKNYDEQNSEETFGKKQEIIDKLNYYRELINHKEDQIFHYEESQKEFFHFFENQFNDIYKYKDLTQFKSSILELETMVNNNKEAFLNNKISLNEKNVFSQNISEIFSFIEDNLQINKINENYSIDHLKEFSKMIRDHATGEINKDLSNLKSTNKKISSKYIYRLSDQKSKIITERRDQLLSTAYLKKTKCAYGEDDLLISPEDNNKILPMKKNLILRNFLQIYLVKENDIFSQTYFSKYDPSVLYSYRRYKFYEIKICISIDEFFSKINKCIESIRTLFQKYFMIYKHDIGRNFIKVIICGIGRRQSEVKNSIIKLINNDLSRNCLIKISLFSNVFDCMRSNIDKIYYNNQVNTQIYSYHTNFKDELLKKILKKLKKNIF